LAQPTCSTPIFVLLNKGSILKIMLLLLSLAGVLFSAILLYFYAREYPATIYLGLFFLTVSLYGINQYVVLFSKSFFLNALIVTNISFTAYLIGPMLYWYIRSTLSDNSLLKWTDLLHLLPMLVYLAAALPYMLTPFSYKVEIAREIIKDVGFLGTYKFTVLSDIFSNMAVYLSRPLLTLAYTLWSVAMLIRYWLQGKKSQVLSGQFFMIKWLSVFLGFQLLLTICHIASVFMTFAEGSDVFYTLNLLQFMSGLGMIVILCSPLFLSRILFGMPRIPDSYFRKETM
jgi:hypothetical protein